MNARTARRFAPLTIGALVALSLTLVAGPAQAHDELVSTNPADKAQVQTVPDSILLTFEEPAEQVGSQVIVRGPTGNVAQGAPVFVKSTVTQAVQPGAPAGKYTVLWRVTSDDGHPVSGSFTFTAAAAGVTATPEASPTASQRQRQRDRCGRPDDVEPGVHRLDSSPLALAAGPAPAVGPGGDLRPPAAGRAARRQPELTTGAAAPDAVTP